MEHMPGVESCKSYVFGSQTLGNGCWNSSALRERKDSPGDGKKAPRSGGSRQKQDRRFCLGSSQSLAGCALPVLLSGQVSLSNIMTNVAEEAEL